MAAYEEYAQPVTDEKWKYVCNMLRTYAWLIRQMEGLDVLDVVTVLHEVAGCDGDVGHSPMWTYPQVVALLGVYTAMDLELMKDVEAELG